MNNLINPWLYYDALQCFTNNLFGSVRSILIDNEPWFIGSDVAKCLGYKNPTEAIQDHVYDHYKMIKPSELLGLGYYAGRNEILINEAGIYQLIFSSKLPSAKAFADWVYSDVLPTMRRVGFDRSMEILQEENKKLQEEVNKLNLVLKGCDTWSLSAFNKNCLL